MTFLTEVHPSSSMSSIDTGITMRCVYPKNNVKACRIYRNIQKQLVHILIRSERERERKKEKMFGYVIIYFSRSKEELVVSKQDHYLRCTVTNQYVDNCCLAYSNTLSQLQKKTTTKKKKKERENRQTIKRKKRRKRKRRKSFCLILSSLLSISITS